jgi:hypothetical protein
VLPVLAHTSITGGDVAAAVKAFVLADAH